MPRIWAPIAVAALFAVPQANAQNVDTFTFAGAASDSPGTLQLLLPDAGEPGMYAVSGGLSYANSPLVAVSPDGTVTPVVSSLVGTQLATGYTFTGPVRLGLSVPLYPHIGTEEPSAGTGDLRISTLVPISLGMENELRFALAPYVQAPSGTPDTYTSQGAGGGFTAVLAGDTELAEFPIQWVTNLGLDASPAASVGAAQLGTNLRLGAGAATQIDEQTRAGIELTSLIDLAGSGVGNESPMEAHLFAEFAPLKELSISGGIGTGLVAGIGSSNLRLFVGATWRAMGVAPIKDTDKDGLADAEDQCPNEPEDPDNFEDTDGCPDPDNDHDGYVDASDECPNDREDIDNFQDDDGCPEPDNDNDMILDAVDVCPNQAGPVETRGCSDRDGDFVPDSEDLCLEEPGPPEIGGCPDSDGDSVSDANDKCPEVRSNARAAAAYSDGCPAETFVTAKRIETSQRVSFEENGELSETAKEVLAQVAEILNDYPQLFVEVAGHSESLKTDAESQAASERRATSVRAYLTTALDVAPNRLVVRGYGATMPIDTNLTPTGRAANRRVEFRLLER